jgi:hypothetical protein
VNAVARIKAVVGQRSSDKVAASRIPSTLKSSYS